MRVLVDMQVCQTSSRSSDVAHYVRGLVREMATHAEKHEIWLLLNEALPRMAREFRAEFEELIPQDRIRTFPMPTPVAEREDANAWRGRAAALLREHYIANLEPDCVLIPSLFEGFTDEAVVSIGELCRGAFTAVLLHNHEVTRESRLSVTDGPYRDFCYRRLQSLKRADLVLTREQATRRDAIDRLSLADEGILTIPVNGDSDNTKDDDIPRCRQDANINASAAHVGSGDDSVNESAAWLLNALEAFCERASESDSAQAGELDSRPRLAYVSPLPPERTGIADYSAELIPELARFYDIVLITDQAEVTDPWLTANFAVHSVAWFDAHAGTYDRVLYHVGNSAFHAHMPELMSRHPGAMVLHDFFLGHLMSLWPKAFAEALYHSHGYSALQRLESADPEVAVWEYPTNRRVLQDATGVIVHGRYSLDLANYWYGSQPSSCWAEIPHIRTEPLDVDRVRARDQLGIGSDAFVVCSFGMMGPAKLNHRLLEAWAESGLAVDKSCWLVFVGANHAGDYGARLRDRIRSLGGSGRVHITGFADPESYRNWLVAADVAVQLRTSSRGETSGTILDCLGHGLPLIFNAHGTAAEVPDEVGVKLTEDFSDRDLSNALTRLRSNPDLRSELGGAGVSYISRWHHPARIGCLYRDAIEKFSQESPKQRERLLVKALKKIDTDVKQDESDLARVSVAIANENPVVPRQLLIDVSAIVREDLRTGVQRVVRAQLRELLLKPPDGYRVEPIYMVNVDGTWQYHYARKYTVGLLDLQQGELRDEPADVRSGDIFHGLDFFGDGVEEAAVAGLYEEWRARGVRVGFTVYDLLPVQRPEWFPEGVDDRHAKWLYAISRDADILVGISRSVADELRGWVAERDIDRPDSLKIDHVHLGADIESTGITRGRPAAASTLLKRLQARPTFLMVGTIEPRKGYHQALDTFEHLWERGVDLNLVIVGKAGWQQLPENEQRDIPRIVQRLECHPEQGKRLHWLQGVSDEFLEEIYSNSTCLIAASEGEGFGLPLIEAAKRDLPIIARDIPVFREVAGGHASYFSGLEGTAMADTVQAWLELRRAGRAPAARGMPWLTWRESAERLKEVILDGNPLPDKEWRRTQRVSATSR